MATECSRGMVHAEVCLCMVQPGHAAVQQRPSTGATSGVAEGH